MDRFTVDLYKEFVPNLRKELKLADEINCNALITSLFNSERLQRFESDAIACNVNEPPIVRSDMVLTPQEWSHRIIPKLTDTIDCDSDDENIRNRSESILKQEFEFAKHVVADGRIIVKLNGMNTSNLSRIIASGLKRKYRNIEYILSEVFLREIDARKLI